MIALALKPRFVVFITDVAGIYNVPPSQAGAKLLREVFVDSAERRNGEITNPSSQNGPLTSGGHEHDVTGGIY